MPAQTQSAAIRRATNQAHRAVDALDARALQDITGLYQATATFIRQRLAAASGVDDRLTLVELRGVLAQVEERLAQLTQQRSAFFDDVLGEAAQLGVAPFDAHSGEQLYVTSGSLMRISDDALRFVRSFVAKDGLQLSDRIWRLDRATRDGIVGTIERAIILGSSAEEATREYLRRNQQPPEELVAKARAASSSAIGSDVEQAMTGAAAEAKRLFRTEINRAHGEAYMMAGKEAPGFVGWRFLLSPAHPEPDICDLLAEQNLYGLGKGVYPSRELCPWPAHPNTLSYVEIVFQDEIDAEDRAGGETPMQALDRLSPDQRRGALGVGKDELFQQGKLARGAIRSTLAAARRRAGVA